MLGKTRHLEKQTKKDHCSKVPRNFLNHTVWQECMYVKHYLTEGKVEVEYTYTHTNHSPGVTELKHLPLPASVR